MPARLRKTHQLEVRYKIQASQIINRLQKHIDSDSPIMEPSQVQAALGLLRKAVPDLTAIGGSDLMPPVKASVVVKFADGRD